MIFVKAPSLALLLLDVSWLQTPSCLPIVAQHGQSIHHKRAFPLPVLLPFPQDAADLDKPEAGLADVPRKREMYQQHLAMRSSTQTMCVPAFSLISFKPSSPLNLSNLHRFRFVNSLSGPPLTFER